jgi:hypothetical protein
MRYKQQNRADSMLVTSADLGNLALWEGQAGANRMSRNIIVYSQPG